MKRFNAAFLAALGMGALAATTAHAQQSIGAGATAPRTGTMLDVNGPIAVSETTVAATGTTAPTAAITGNVGQVRLTTGTATAGPITVSYAGTANSGQRLVIFNNSAYAATFNSQNIPAAQAVEFVYSNSGWRANGDGGNSVVATNGLTKTGNAIGLGGPLTGATEVATAGNNLTFSGTGKVGVGTTTPAEKLDVSGALQIQGAATQALTAGTGVDISNEAAYGRVQIFGNKPLALNPLGNYVGIGTTAPALNLEVAGTQGAPLFGVRNAAGFDHFYITHDGVGPSLIAGGAETGMKFVVGSNTNTGTYGDASQNYREGMRIMPSGNVGISATNPGEKLEVNGNIRLGSEPGGGATTGWGNFIEFDGAVGSNNDPIGLARYNTAAGGGGNSELRLVVGDDGTGPGQNGADRFVLGTTSSSAGPGLVTSGTFSPKFYIYSNGATGVGIDPAAGYLLDVAGTAGASNVRMASLGGTGTRLMQAAADGTLTTATAASVLQGSTTNALTNTNGTLTSTVNGVAASTTALINANNGLTPTNGVVQLGGNLNKATTIGASNFPLTITGPNNTPTMVIGNNDNGTYGNVGIGTTDVSSYKFTIVSNGLSDNDDTFMASYGGPPSINHIDFASRGTATAPANLQNNDLLSQYSSTGRVNSSPVGLSAISSYYRGNGTTSLSDLTFGTSGFTRMWLDPNGNLGINSYSPGEKLEVNGNIRLGSEPGGGGGTGWGNFIEFTGAAGTNSDPIGLARYNTSTNGGGNSELRLVVGNEGTGPGQNGADRFVLGTTSSSAGPGLVTSGTFSPKFYIYSNGATGIGIDPAASYLLEVGGAVGVTGSNVLEFGVGESKELNAGKIGYNTFSTGLNIVGAGVVPGSRTVVLYDNVTVQGAVTASSYVTSSDARIKSQINTIGYGLQAVMQLQPKQYEQLMTLEMKNGQPVANGAPTKHTIGFVAQDLYKTVPEAVVKPQDEANQIWKVDYTKLVPVLTKAIQEQQAEIEALKAANKAANTKLQGMADGTVKAQAELQDVKASLQSLTELVKQLQAGGTTASSK